MSNEKLNDNELEKVSGGTAPELPATQLDDSCFEGSSLKTRAPGSPAVVLASPNFPAPEIE